ncbi:pilus assembly PilX family protein [Halochromatium roseum]|uniref:pilus assembly PilX family protein n=1 Tax=Halochromatium roseum TaxID=391920 RepID=UPI0019137728|nr:PilX N-terminal domain-containing pilus assembly protein [Halochromatium roseum]
MGARRQRGVVLAVSLILLTVMTLLGVTAMTVNSQHENMASNTRQRNLAFQSAEACIREAEGILAGASLPVFDGSTVGYRPSFAAAGAGEMLDYCWNGSEADCDGAESLVGPQLVGLAEPCRFVIEELLITGLPADGSVKLAPIDTTRLYRVTARGVGGVEDAVAIVQTLYRR